MKLRLAAGIGFLCFSASAPGAAAVLNGKAVNRSTGMPAAGDEVILVSLKGGAKELGRVRTDANGRFRFNAADLREASLVRVVHQGVAYSVMTAPGADHAEVEVYDAAPNVQGAIATSKVQRMQAEGGTLQVIEDIVVRNNSNPPRTIVNVPFEIRLPAEAEIIAGRVQAAGGQPMPVKPTPAAQKGQYYLPILLRPGETRFAIAYKMPYTGEAGIDPKVLYPLEQFTVVLPQSMKFEPAFAGVYQPAPGHPNVQQAVALKAGQTLAFRITGKGSLAASEGGRQPAQGSQTPSGQASRPAPSVSWADRWLLAGGFTLVLATIAAGLISYRRKQFRRLPV